MDISPFNIYYSENNVMHTVEVIPCCREDNVVDYAIRQEGKLAFTITKDREKQRWVVALKNADDEIDEELVQLLGIEIEKITGLSS
jgi:hypothetical protein